MKRIYLLIMAIWVISISCKDEITKPTETKERDLQILAYQKDCNTNVCDLPVAAQINIIEQAQDGTQKQVFNSLTSTAGSATYASSASTLFPSIYKVEAIYNNMTITKTFAICTNDSSIAFCFDCNPPLVTCCDGLPADTTVFGDFINEFKNKSLIQNKPDGIGYYTYNLNLVTNGCPATDMVVTIPTLVAPFSFERISPTPTGNKVTLKPGQTLSATVKVSTKDAGLFTINTNNIYFQISCNNKTSIWRPKLSAEVVAPTCDCSTINDTITVNKTNKVSIGNSENYSNLILTNDLQNCNITIDSYTKTSSLGAFTITGDKTVIMPGEDLNGNIKFTPKLCGTNADTFKVAVTLSNGIKCERTVILSGLGCDPAICATLNGKAIDGVQTIEGGSYNFLPENCNNCPYDTSFTSISGSYYFNKSLTFNLPDCACTSGNYSVSIEQNDFNMFSVNNASFLLNPGESKSISIGFTSPTKSEFKKMKPNAATAADSCFVLKLRITGCGKSQIYQYTACLSDFGKFSNILYLYAYNQQTYGIDDKTTTRDYKVCLVNVLNQSIGLLGLINTMENPVGSNKAPTPLAIGSGYADFYVNPENEADTVLSGPPQTLRNPGIYLTKNNCRYVHIKRFKQNISGNNFQDKISMTNQLCGLGAGYFDKAAPRNASGLVAGDVYVIYSDDLKPNGYPCLIALIHVISVDNGSFNIEKRCGISFRLYFPVDC